MGLSWCCEMDWVFRIPAIQSRLRDKIVRTEQPVSVQHIRTPLKILILFCIYVFVLQACFTDNLITGRKLIYVNCIYLPRLGVTDFKHIQVLSRGRSSTCWLLWCSLWDHSLSETTFPFKKNLLWFDWLPLINGLSSRWVGLLGSKARSVCLRHILH